jgi:hypothetical protein
VVVARSEPVDTAVAEPVLAIEESSAYEPAETSVLAESSDTPVAELQPGDVIIPAETAFVEPVATISSEPEAVAEPQSIIRQPEPTSSNSWTSNWLLWAGAGGSALALFFIGRLVRGRFGSSPIAPSKPRRRPRAVEAEPIQADSIQVEAIQMEPIQSEPAEAEPAQHQPMEAFAEVDIEIDDDSPTAENPALDADLLKGTGLQEGSDVEIAQDFDFASTTELDLDLELPEEPAEATEVPMTDILPPLHAEDDKILEDEVLPGDDEYDFSVMLDATKMPNPDDVTERDLEAVQVPDNDDTLINDDYTVSNEVDYKVLEQDYEDEMTATQALSEEIMKAAEDTAISDDLDVTAEVAANDLPKSGKKAG